MSHPSDYYKQSFSLFLCSFFALFFSDCFFFFFVKSRECDGKRLVDTSSLLVPLGAWTTRRPSGRPTKERNARVGELSLQNRKPNPSQAREDSLSSYLLLEWVTSLFASTSRTSNIFSSAQSSTEQRLFASDLRARLFNFFVRNHFSKSWSASSNSNLKSRLNLV